MSQNNAIKITKAFVFDNLTKICTLKVGDTIETNNGTYKVADFTQIVLEKDCTPYPGYCVLTENGEKILSKDVVNVVGTDFVEMPNFH